MGQFLKLGEHMRSIKQQMLSRLKAYPNHPPRDAWRAGGRWTTLPSCPLSRAG